MKVLQHHEIRGIDDINLSKLAELFHQNRAALRAFRQNDKIGLSVSIEREPQSGGTYFFSAQIPVNDGKMDQARLNSLNETLLDLHNAFAAPTIEGEPRRQTKFNLATIRREMTARNKRVNGPVPALAASFTNGAAATGIRQATKKTAPQFPLSQMLEDGSIVINRDKILVPTPGQKRYLEVYDQHQAIVIDGPAGSGKTEFAIYMALRDLKLGYIERIILCASIQKDEEDPGFLPGDMDEKMDPMINQMLEKIDKHLGAGDLGEGRKVRERLQAKGFIQIKGLADLGGESFENAVVIVDEAHQAKEQRLNIAIGRAENPIHDGKGPGPRKNAKIIFAGHSHQNTTQDGASVYGQFWSKYLHPEYAGHAISIQFTSDDVRRSRLLEIMARLGHDVSQAEIDRARRDQYGLARISGILNAHFAAATGKNNPKLDLLVSKLVGQLDIPDLAQLIEEELGISGAPELNGQN